MGTRGVARDKHDFHDTDAPLPDMPPEAYDAPPPDMPPEADDAPPPDMPPEARPKSHYVKGPTRRAEIYGVGEWTDEIAMRRAGLRT